MSDIAEVLDRSYDLGSRMADAYKANVMNTWYSLCDTYYLLLENLPEEQRDYADAARQAGVREDNKHDSILIIIQNYEHRHEGEARI